MPTPTKGPRLGGGPAHERLILANLATALFEHGRITTTEAKARRLRPLAERLITKAKRGDLHARRQVLSVIRDKTVVHELFAEIGPRYENRHGGYTRITKVGPRKGDNAPMAVIELVEALTVQQTAVSEAEAATKRTAKKAPAKKAATRKAAAAAQESTGAETGLDSEADVTSEQVEDAATEAPAEGAADTSVADGSAADEASADEEPPTDTTDELADAEVADETADAAEGSGSAKGKADDAG